MPNDLNLQFNAESPKPSSIDTARRFCMQGAMAASAFVLILAGTLSALCDWSSLLRPNELGDLLAGLFAPIAAIWAVAAFLLSSLELRAQLDEVRATQEIFRQQLDGQLSESALEARARQPKASLREALANALLADRMHYEIDALKGPILAVEKCFIDEPDTVPHMYSEYYEQDIEWTLVADRIDPGVPIHAVTKPPEHGVVAFRFTNLHGEFALQAWDTRGFELREVVFTS